MSCILTAAMYRLLVTAAILFVYWVGPWAVSIMRKLFGRTGNLESDGLT